MLCGVIPAQKRTSGCQRAEETGRVRVLLSLGTAHKRTADLVSVRPRSLCSSPTGCAKHQGCEKVIQAADSPAEMWSSEGFLCCWRGISSQLCEAFEGEGALIKSRGLWEAQCSCRGRPGGLEHLREVL